MVTIYTTPSCTSCRKAIVWLEEYGIPYKKRNISTTPLSEEEIKGIMSLTENGTDDIISTRSKAFADLNVDIDELSLSDLFSLIQNKTNLVKRPIIVDDKRVQIGYNESEIRKFIPREIRDIELSNFKQKLLIN